MQFGGIVRSDFSNPGYLVVGAEPGGSWVNTWPGPNIVNRTLALATWEQLAANLRSSMDEEEATDDMCAAWPGCA